MTILGLEESETFHICCSEGIVNLCFCGEGGEQGAPRTQK